MQDIARKWGRWLHLLLIIFLLMQSLLPMQPVYAQAEGKAEGEVDAEMELYLPWVGQSEGQIQEGQVEGETEAPTATEVPTGVPIATATIESMPFTLSHPR